MRGKGGFFYEKDVGSKKVFSFMFLALTLCFVVSPPAAEGAVMEEEELHNKPPPATNATITGQWQVQL